MELKLHKKFYTAASFAFSALLLGFTAYLLAYNPEFLDKFLQSTQVLFTFYKHPLLYFVIFLLFVNWGCEAIKWKLLVSPVAEISLYQAYRSVLLGLSTSFFTPRSIGEYFGRILSLPEIKDKWILTGGVFIAQLAQLSVTLGFGLYGLSILYQEILLDQKILLLIASLVVLFLVFILLIFRVQIISVLLSLWPRFFRLFRLLKVYKPKLLSSIFVWSLTRHLVYSLQMILVLVLLKPELNIWQVFPYICLLLFAKTIFPSFNMLSDMGVREFSNIYFLGLCGIEPQIALTCGLFIWFINILFPTLLGGILLWRK